MLDLHSQLRLLKRPRLLVQAARFGLEEYRRERDLPRALQTESLPRTADALMRLLSREAELNDARLRNAAHYDLATHIAVLTAIMAEAQVLQDSARSIRPAT